MTAENMQYDLWSKLAYPRQDLVRDSVFFFFTSHYILYTGHKNNKSQLASIKKIRVN